MVKQFVRVKFQKLEDKLKKIIDGLQEVSELSTNELGKLGKSYARLLAPKYSGKTYRYIVYYKPSKSNPSGKIIAKNPTLNDGHRRKIPSFNLVRWMAESARAEQHIKTGEPKFMEKTTDMLKDIKAKIAFDSYNKIFVRKQINI
jgi:hypothetical protein